MTEIVRLPQSAVVESMKTSSGVPKKVGMVVLSAIFQAQIVLT